MIKRFLAKLVNWEGPRGAHKPSTEEVFQREQRRDRELAEEREKRHKQNIQEDKWQEVKLPVSEGNPDRPDR